MFDIWNKVWSFWNDTLSKKGKIVVGALILIIILVIYNAFG